MTCEQSSIFVHAMVTQIMGQIDWKNQRNYFNTTLNLFLDNQDLLEECNTGDDCILGCFDLDYKLINC